jgi:hypothetical protein
MARSSATSKVDFDQDHMVCLWDELPCTHLSIYLDTGTRLPLEGLVSRLVERHMQCQYQWSGILEREGHLKYLGRLGDMCSASTSDWCQYLGRLRDSTSDTGTWRPLEASR